TDADKLAALKQMRGEITETGEPAKHFDLAKQLVGSTNNDIRWQSLIVIGEYLPSGTRNEDIWDIIISYSGIDDDMQDALA
ncbi:hypothetical protein, partial [Salmonella sp. SAL4433]|uniref:hypothetical protein n=1 Tax=Salmonella sp. SAL4433 TaxID=3159888 RepID=UPI00397E671B